MLRCARSPRSNVLARTPPLLDFSRALPLRFFEQPANRVFQHLLVFSMTIQAWRNCPGLPEAPGARATLFPLFPCCIRHTSRASDRCATRPAEATSEFSSNRKTIDIPPVRRYCSGQKKRWFKIPIRSRSARSSNTRASVPTSGFDSPEKPRAPAPHRA